MDTYKFRLQHVNSEHQLQDDSLDSFSTVIHYDSSLIDQQTGRKPDTHLVADSSQFAWSSSKNLAHPSQPHLPPTPSREQRVLPTPFIGTQSSKRSKVTTSASEGKEVKPESTTKSDLAQQIGCMIRDVYSGIDIPFQPLQLGQKSPAEILLDYTLCEDSRRSQQPQHIVAQPSRVKVTHVYSQCVLSQLPQQPAPVTQLVANHSQPSVTQCDISTLLQVSANTRVLNSYFGQESRRLSSMAESNSNLPGGSNSQPFESVADALHLQQSVIGGRHMTPVSADVVAQVVAEAERKIKLGHTPTPLSASEQHPAQIPSPDANSLPTGDNPTVSVFSLPPPPKLPDPVATRELIRVQASNLVRTTEKSSWFGTSPQAKAREVQSSNVTLTVDQPQAASQDDDVVTMSQLETIMDDNLSVASTSSEIETINDNATEAFLKSLPPFKAINLSSILPENRPVRQQSHSPPVKETSFRPLSQTKHKPEEPQSYQPFVTKSGVFSATANTGISQQAKILPTRETKFVIPQVGPLFQNSPRTVNKSNFSVPSQTQLEQKHGLEVNAQVDEILREKIKLEGQLEMLSIEAQATMQERAELQAQVASLKLKLMSQKAQKHDTGRDILRADLEALKQLRVALEESLAELQKELEEKSEEGRNLQEELNQSQEACDKLNLKLKEIKDEVRAKEMTIQALKNKVAELYVEVQTAMQTKIEADNEARSAKSDLVSLQNTKDWYQQQLELATKARSELQREMTLLQAQAASQTSIIDRLKQENNRLRQQFSEIQNKALKEKELLAKHLEAIESDMMDREAAFQEIQRERSFLEDTFNTKIQSAEDEKNRITLLMQMTTDLENQLDKAHADLKKKQNQIVMLENENIELMKKLSLSQESAMEKDSIIEDLKRSLIDVEERLKAFQNSIINKDAEILVLKEEKAKTEIALKSALLEKNSVDQVLDSLRADMGKVETSFKVMRHELSTKSVEMNEMKTHTLSSSEQIEKLKTELENERRTCELTKLELEKKSEQYNDLQGQKIKLDGDIMILSEKLSSMENAHEEAIKEKQLLDSELQVTQEKLYDLKQKVHEEEKTQKSSDTNADIQAIQEECVQLRNKVSELEKGNKKDQLRFKAKTVKMTQDLNAVKDELIERQKTFDENMDVISSKLKEVAAEKERLETELSMVHRKYKLSLLEQKDQIDSELQSLASELQQAQLQRQELEGRLVELQQLRDMELEQYQQQLAALETQLQQAVQAQAESSAATDNSRQLALELEKERGRVEGLQQNAAGLKQHVSQLEAALAGRESALVDLQTQMELALRERDEENHSNIKRVQTLEDQLQKEKDAQRDARKQIGQKITENKKLRRNNDNLKQEIEQTRQELEQRNHERSLLQAELDEAKQRVGGQQAELSAYEGQQKSLQRELARLQQQLQDNADRQPVIQEHIKSLEWQLQLKSHELEAAQAQVQVEEERQLAEIHGVRQLLQEKNNEIESLKLDLAAMKQDKQNQLAKFTELRSALKTSIQHHKLTEKMSKLKPLNGSGDADSFDLPPLPFDLEDMDKLLQDTTFRALESKPLDNLQNCLLNLRSEISGLQHQMDAHANTIETSTNTWMHLENEVAELVSVVQTIASTTLSTATTNSLAAAAVQLADNSSRIMDI